MSLEKDSRLAEQTVISSNTNKEKNNGSRGLLPTQVESFLSKLSFVVISHVAFTGHAQELRDFLVKKTNKLLFIGHPFSYAPEKRSFVEYYENGVLKNKLAVPKVAGPEFLLYLNDFVVSAYLILRFRRKWNVCVGIDPLNAFFAIMLKKLGFSKTTIFYVIDYVPCRFSNPVLNVSYRLLDKICVYHCDYTWNLTSSMADARQKIGISKRDTNQITVPTGAHTDKILDKPSLKDNRIVFLSHLRKGQGIEIVLDALPRVVECIPSLQLIVIGTGPLEKYFVGEVQKRNLSDNVEFLGYVESHAEIERIVSNCKLGIAPYVPNPDSFTWYADPGKPKVYLGCGIPVVITKVPEVAFEISKRKAGIAINYSSEELSNAIIELLSNNQVYESYRLNAINFAKELNWDNIFLEALSKSGINVGCC